MKIDELHRKVMALEPLPYDPRLSAAISEEGYKRYRTNTGHTYYLYLQALVRILRPRLILELGTDIGRSAAFMMTALPLNSRLVTVELGPQPRTDLVPFAGDQRLSILHGDSRDLSVYGMLDVRFIDLLYIDSDHNYEQVRAEWDLYRHFMAPGAVVAMDDIHLNPGMERFWNELPFTKVDAGRDIHVSGWGIFAPENTVREP